jgi:alkanesulfonate monooxygenase SsuD/methylene tetrahydromethanopterin reductase-like flavin-dependent oxidoreductase (luciferase family)
VSEGRAGWRPRMSASPQEARHFGRREFPPLTPENVTDPAVAAHLSDLFDEAADAVEVVRRLWDSWDDDAVIRDVPGGRFADRDKLHYTDFDGRWFAVRGPSITPRPPQGQPVVASLAHSARCPGCIRGGSTWVSAGPGRSARRPLASTRPAGPRRQLWPPRRPRRPRRPCGR